MELRIGSTARLARLLPEPGVMVIQAVLGNASPSLTALVSQGLRQRNILPPRFFGPEGNFSNGPDIVQTVAGLLGLAQSPQLTPALAPLGTCRFLTSLY